MTTCTYCTQPNITRVLDHVDPKSRRGLDHPINLTPACVWCNGEKSDRTPEEWASDRDRVGLSWPPINRDTFVAELDDALDPATRLLLGDAIDRPEMQELLLGLWKAARSNPGFTFPDAAKALADAA